MNAPFKAPRNAASHQFRDLKPLNNPDQWDISTPRFADCDAHVAAVLADRSIGFPAFDLPARYRRAA